MRLKEEIIGRRAAEGEEEDAAKVTEHQRAHGLALDHKRQLFMAAVLDEGREAEAAC